MKVSELIAALSAMQEQHGDIPVYLDDPDTGWALIPEVAMGKHPVDGEVVTVTADYDSGREYLEGRP